MAIYSASKNDNTKSFACWKEKKKENQFQADISDRKLHQRCHKLKVPSADRLKKKMKSAFF